MMMIRRLQLSEAEPDEVVDDAERDGERQDDDGQEDKVRRVWRQRDAGVTFEQVATLTCQVPAEIAVQRVWNE